MTNRHTRKLVTMAITVSAPAWMNVAAVRREVRSLIDDQCNWLSYGPGDQEVDGKTIQVRKIEPVRRDK